MFFGFRDPREYALFMLALHPGAEGHCILRGQMSWAEFCMTHGGEVEMSTVIYLQTAYAEVRDDVPRTAK
jgi:hypothetical protein